MSLNSFIAFSVFTLASIVGLALLGNWQLERLELKRDRIKKINARITAPPITLAEVMKRNKGDGDINYLRVQVRGKFEHDKERFLFATFETMKGWHVYTPLKLDNGRVLFVNRGFVPDEVKSPELREAGQPKGEVLVTGLIRRPGEKGIFDPKNDLVGNAWYWRDLSNMVASVYDKTAVSAYPFFLEAEDLPNGNVWPRGGVTRVVLRNNHMQYALTWFGLAISLIAVYGFFLKNWLNGE